jgi:hypothetical protein
MNQLHDLAQLFPVLGRTLSWELSGHDGRPGAAAGGTNELED